VEIRKFKIKDFNEFTNENSSHEQSSSHDIVNECIVIGGKLDDKMFLFKNRDRSFTPESKVVREDYKGTEIVYYTDETGWVEGMNEHGIGFVFSALIGKEYEGYDPSYHVTDKPKPRNKRELTKFSKFREGILKVLTSKNVDEAVKRILDSGKSGNFIVSDKEKMIELEVFKGKQVIDEVDLTEIRIKNNHGELIPEAGHQPNSNSVKRPVSTIRQQQAKTQLYGVKSLGEIPTRMKFQAFDFNSPLNTYRTDSEEHTISQCLMNLTDLEFFFFHDNLTANHVVMEDKLENGNIKIEVRES
jgi:hypothetical protein